MRLVLQKGNKITKFRFITLVKCQGPSTGEIPGLGSRGDNLNKGGEVGSYLSPL